MESYNINDRKIPPVIYLHIIHARIYAPKNRFTIVQAYPTSYLTKYQNVSWNFFMVISLCLQLLHHGNHTIIFQVIFKFFQQLSSKISRIFREVLSFDRDFR